MLTRSTRLLSYLICIILLFFVNFAHADKTFPGNLPSGCSGSGSAYTCGALNISENYFFTGSGAVTVTVNGDLTINNYTIGQWNDNANVTFVVNGNVTIAAPTINANINAGSHNITYNGAATTSGSLTTTTGNISTRGVVYGHITTNSGTITVNANSTSQIWGEITVKNATSTNYIYINQDAVVNGAIYTNSTSTTANLHVNIAERATINGSIIALGRDYTYVNINYDAIVNGDVIAFGDDAAHVTLYDRARINGNVKSTSVDIDDGDVDLNASSRITGNITAYGDINNYGQINGCANSTYTTGTNISLRSGSSNSGGSCCGSNRTSCNSSCVSNSSSFSTTLCQSAEAIVVNAYGQTVNGVGPIMELWVNQVKVDTVVVNSTTAQNYTFYANLPATPGFKLDLVFPNDAYLSPSEDRNLIINSITYQSKTISSTDSRVIRDWGNNSTEYFDGINTDVPNIMLHSNGAMRFDTSADATLIAKYAMDEASWNGTSGELKDTAGYTGGPFNGTGIGTPKPTATSSSPARTGTTGTCGYAVLGGNLDGGSAFSIPSLPTNTSNGTKTSVSFWMYWDGTDYITPIGWNYYNLYFADGYFGFNTGSQDLLGVSTSGLANGWHHVVAVFNNGNVSGSKLYIDGVYKTLTQLYGAYVTNANAYVTSTLLVGGWTVDSNYRFIGGRIDEVKVYKGEMTSTQVSADYNATHACPVYVSNVNANSFNCIASQESNVASGRLYTQMAGNSFGIKVIALKTGGTAAETSFSTATSRDVTLKFIDQTNSNAITFNDGSDKTVKTLTFPAGDTTGVLSVSGLTINNAYKNLKCQIYDATASTPTSLSNDSFSVRPYQLIISSTNATDSSGTSVANTQKIIAGANFNLTTTAKNASGTTLTGYNGTPSVSLTSITPHTGAIATGTLSGSFSSAASSGVASANFTYSEVGYFKLNAGAVTDTSFIATVDSAANGDCTDDFSVTAVSGKYGCKIQNISESSYFGRFIPQRFNVDDASVTSSNACASFTYYGQDGFNTQFILRAQNMSGGRTKNYHGSYAKLDINTWTDDSALTGLKFLATNLPSGVSLLAGSSNPTGSWSQGQATIYATHKLSRPTNAVAPVNLVLKTNPLDSDGVYVINNTPEAANIPANSLFRYGRLWVPNQYGSELLNLTVPIEAQYYDGSTYRRNQLDSCSVINPQNIAMSNYKGNLAACESVISGGGTMSSGKTTVTLAKPGYGNNGSVDLSINLNSASGSTCTTSTATSATNADLPWFGSTNPTARETFGLFKSPVIYMRESY